MRVYSAAAHACDCHNFVCVPLRGASFFENRFIMLVLSVVIALASSNIIGGLALGESEY